MSEATHYAPTMTIHTFHKDEWSRMATAAYADGRNGLGHQFSAAAALRHGEAIPLKTYDALMDLYRAWLVFGWAEVERVQAGQVQ